MSGKPDLVFIEDILQKWKAYRVPTIQRGFVWNEQRIKDFFESIINGLPVGVLILWTPKNVFPSVPLVDSSDDTDTSNTYVLDGQQRLTSLFLAYYNWEITRDGEKISVKPIYYDPEKKELFVSSSKSAEKKGVNLSLILRAFALQDPVATRELMKNYSHLFQELSEIARKILKYKIPYYELEEDLDYETAADIFVKVNSAGVKIENMHMFFSLFVGKLPREHSDIRDNILAIYEKYGSRKNSFGLNFETILRFIFHNLGAKQTQIGDKRRFKKTISEVWERYSGNIEELRDIISKSEKSIDITLEFLEKELGIVNTRFIPSQNALLPLFKFFYVNEYRELKEVPRSEKQKLAKWFILASYSGRYSANSKIDKDLEIITKGNFPINELMKYLKEDQYFTIKDFLKDSDKFADATKVQGRKYLMLLIIALFKKNARDWTIQEKPILERIKEDANGYNIHHIFPREFLKNKGIIDNDIINDLGNLTIIDQTVNTSIGKTAPDTYLPQYKKFLNEHFIPDDAELWSIKNFEKFLRERRRQIYEFILSNVLS